MKLPLKLKQIVLVPALALSLSGCSTIGGWFASGDDSFAPAELTKITPEVSIQARWSEKVSNGVGKREYQLDHLVDGDTVYAVAADGTIAAHHAITGQQLWMQNLFAQQSWVSSYRFWKKGMKREITAGIGMSDRYLLMADSSGQVMALNKEGGEAIWSTQLDSEILVAPVCASGIVVVHTVDGKVVALDESSGEKIWSYWKEVPALTLRGTSRPVIVKDRVVVGLDSGDAVALNLTDGREIWRHQVAAPRGRTEIERVVDIDADPVVFDGLVYLVSYQGNLKAVSLDSGKRMWEQEFSGVSAPVVLGNYLFVADTDGKVWALDRLSGDSVWEQEVLRNRELTTPATLNGNLVFGDVEGYLHWLSGDNGRIMGRTRIDKSSIHSTPLRARDWLIVYTKKGRLSAVSAR